MTSEYTPTTKDVRDEYKSPIDAALDGEEFDRWLLAEKHSVLKDARSVISQYLATAETWRYNRVMWAFAIMLGEIPEDTPEP